MKQFADEATSFTVKILNGPPKRTEASGVISFDKGYGVYFRILWSARLSLPTGNLRIEYERNLPTGKTWTVDSISLKGRVDLRGRNIWYFFCPRRVNRKCKKVIQKLWLSDTGMFGCKFCADVNYRSSRINDHSLHGLFRDPKAMIRILSSKTVPMKRKLRVLEIARHALARRDQLKRKLARLQKRLKYVLSHQPQSDTHPDKATQSQNPSAAADSLLRQRSEDNPRGTLC